jgi:aminoglycoside 3-N-acetyltransferase
MGEASPLARMEELGARVLLLGAEFEVCSSFHLAEYRRPGARVVDSSFAAMVGGERRWMVVKDVLADDGDFGDIGKGLENEEVVVRGMVGAAQCRLFSLPDAVAFATQWMETHRLFAY